MSDTGGTCEYVLDPDDPETWGGEEGDECYVDEDVLNDDGVWTCPHNAVEGEELCIFHLPNEKKEDRVVVEKFLNQIESGEFLGAKFGEFNLKEMPTNIIDCDGGIDLSYILVDGEINWSEILFDVEYLRLAGIKSLGSVKSQHTIYNSYVNMYDAEFRNEVDFFDAEFKKEVNIRKSRFSAKVKFMNSSFEEKLFCNDAEYEAAGNFGSITVGDTADFRDTTFRKNAQFTFSNFEGVADFSNAKFKQDILFLNSEFEGKAKFFEIDLDGEALFDKSKFNKEVNFGWVEFNQRASFQNTEFVNEASFIATEFKTDVDFRNAEFNDTGDFNNSVIISGNFSSSDLAGSNFSYSELTNPDFKKANLTDADLSGSSIETGDLERSRLNRADLFGTNLRGTAFYGAVTGDAQINEETEFGDRCVYDPEFNDEPAADIDEDETGRLTKAAGQYRIIEQLARINAFPDMVSHNFIRRQDIHREQHRQEGRWGRWLRATASKYVLEYGENPWRLIATGLIIVVGFGLLYPLVGGLQPTGGSPITASRVIESPLLLAQSIYYSTLTFTTLGMGDFLPVGLGRVLTTIETSLGAIIIALLVFVFGRRAAR